MKKHFLFSLLFVTFFHQLGLAQVQKGMHTFEFNWSNNLSNFDDVDNLDLPSITLPVGSFASTRFNKSSFQLSLGYDRMISDKWMIGAAFHIEKNNWVEAFASYYTSLDTTPTPYEPLETQWSGSSNSSFEYAFAPRVRYYFINKKLAAFALLETSFGRGRCKQLDVVPPTSLDGSQPRFEGSEYGFCFNSMGGVGANYFLSSNIALEATFATTIWNNNERIKRTFLGNIGVNVFLQAFKTYTKDAMAESMLRKGNMSVNIISQFNRNINEKFAGNLVHNTVKKELNFMPSIRYFLTDHLEVDLNLSRSKVNNNLSYRDFKLLTFGLNSSYYLKTVNSIYIKPTIGINLNQVKYANGPTDRHWSIPSSLSINYFSANKKYAVGTSYTYQTNDNSSNSWEVFTGLDYFLTEKLSINSKLQFSIYGRPDKENIHYYTSNKRLNLEMGIGFWW